jgi:hypothetical protein
MIGPEGGELKCSLDERTESRQMMTYRTRAEDSNTISDRRSHDGA